MLQARISSILIISIIMQAGSCLGVDIKDYGVHGHLFPVKEESLLVEIMHKLQKAKTDGTLDQLQQEFTDKVKAKILRPVSAGNIKKAAANRSWTYNPIYTQKTDIRDGSNKIIIKAGTSVNALDKLKWGDPLLFIDGDDDDQVKWAEGIKGKIVLVNGAPLDLEEKLGRRVYFDQAGILCSRFKIEAVPAIIEQDGKLLKISEVAL